MHHPMCSEESVPCRLGDEGHCPSCPHRGRSDARWVLVSRLRSAAYSVEKGYPHDQIEPDLAALLWPEGEREWIERNDEWVTRARYWASIRTQDLIRELLREIVDLRAGCA